jgi:hypothetical protein
MNSGLSGGQGTFRQVAYHSPMRRFVHILLIALLLLRGGMDVAMATTMALGMPATLPAASHHAMVMAEPATPQSETAAMADCAGHTAALQNQHVDAVATLADTLTHTAPDSSHADCDSCSVCQACHSVALSSSTAAPAHAQTVSDVPNGAQSQFASADAAQGQKPPIS